jgi:hypothetical protein
VMIFLFFMITDPKTVPSGQVGRVVFGVLVAIVSTLLLAPQTDEFGTKVGLLAGLVVLCAVRPLLERVLPEARSASDDLRAIVTGLTRGSDGETAGRRGGGRRVALRAAAAALSVLIVGSGIVLAGAPARGVIIPDTAEVLNRLPTAVNPATLPRIHVSQEVIDFDYRLGGDEMQQVAVTLTQNLELENQALLTRDGTILAAVDHGDRLAEMLARLQTASAGGPTAIDHYQFDAIDVSLLRPFGVQTGLSLGLAATGTAVHETYNAAGHVESRTTSPFTTTFVMRRATGDRWLNVAVLP